MHIASQHGWLMVRIPLFFHIKSAPAVGKEGYLDGGQRVLRAFKLPGLLVMLVPPPLLNHPQFVPLITVLQHAKLLEQEDVQCCGVQQNLLPLSSAGQHQDLPCLRDQAKCKIRSAALSTHQGRGPGMNSTIGARTASVCRQLLRSFPVGKRRGRLRGGRFLVAAWHLLQSWAVSGSGSFRDAALCCQIDVGVRRGLIFIGCCTCQSISLTLRKLKGHVIHDNLPGLRLHCSRTPLYWCFGHSLWLTESSSALSLAPPGTG
jgi:hypothetical protein